MVTYAELFQLIIALTGIVGLIVQIVKRSDNRQPSHS